MDTRIKKAKIPRLFVEKLGNSWLLPAFSASIREILSLFSLAPHSCKALIMIFSVEKFGILGVGGLDGKD